MKDSHKKIKSWYNRRRTGYGSSLLLRNGDVIPCDGVTHEQICRVAGTTLGAFLEDDIREQHRITFF